MPELETNVNIIDNEDLEAKFDDGRSFDESSFKQTFTAVKTKR